MYKIYFNRQSRKALFKAPKKIADDTRVKLNEIALAPFKRRINVKRLKGRPGYQLRSGEWRVIYMIESKELIIVVVKIALRGDVYK